MKTSELLREGYDRLLVKGIGRGVYALPDGRVCSLGALGIRHLPTTRAEHEAVEVLMRAVVKPSRYCSVAGWHDNNSDDVVLDGWLRAIKLAEADEAEQSGGLIPVSPPERPAPLAQPGQGD